MTFKTILVSLNDVSRSDTLIATSVALAEKHDAHLIGVYVIPAPQIYPSMSPHVTPVIIDEFKTFFEERCDKCKADFNEAVRKAGVRAEWRKIEAPTSNIADAVIEHGLQADLIVASQKNEKANDGLEANFCERLVMESGRPVLLIPCMGQIKSIGENVIVGWNATREASRAVFDSLPILETSKSTRLIWVDPHSDGERSGNIPGSEMATTLARHGVKSIAEAMPTNHLDGGNALLNRAAELGADMIVTGAYGHSRMREFVFGGTTRTLLSDMTVPVLMSH